MRAAGRILAEVKERLKALVRPGASTKDIDEDIESFIVGKGAVSAFKGYRGYPATVCTSINNEVVHGIPSAKRKLKDGVIIGRGQAGTVQARYGGSAITLPVG